MVLLTLAAFPRCSDNFDEVITEEIGEGNVPGSGDTLAPVPGNAGLISATETGTTTVVLQWEIAADETTPQAELLYSVYISDNPDIDSLNGIDAYGVEYTSGWYLDLDSITIRGLDPDRTYYCNVLVSDRAGNRAHYAMLQVKTDEIPAVDSEPPVPVNDGELIVYQPQSNSVRIRWQKPTDNVTLSDNLEYQIYFSLLPDIDTYDTIITNGTYASRISGTTYAAGTWIRGLNNELIEGLTSETAYYFNVLVRDEAGNMAVFAMEPGTTE